MNFPWKLARCAYLGCKFKAYKRSEIHCWKHHELILDKLQRRMVKWL